jgi:hypothetical protein
VFGWVVSVKSQQAAGATAIVPQPAIDRLIGLLVAR